MHAEPRNVRVTLTKLCVSEYIKNNIYKRKNNNVPFGPRIFNLNKCPQAFPSLRLSKEVKKKNPYCFIFKSFHMALHWDTPRQTVLAVRSGIKALFLKMAEGGASHIPSLLCRNNSKQNADTVQHEPLTGLDSQRPRAACR